jgi:enterobactin synthetase component D / holo-[acyl-carrier protein] synthase
MLEEILPRGVAVAAARDDIVDVSLYPEEEAIVARAVEGRRREFATGRACARAALAQLGLAPQPILSGERGAPRWPRGIVGSITHCHGYRACAVARAGDLASIGVDAEPNEPLPEGLLKDIASPGERETLRGLARLHADMHWDRLLFSAKEAVYKAWFPLTEKWLGFEDAEISIDPASASFSARLLVRPPRLGDGELRGFSGRWIVSDGLVLTAIAHPAIPSGGEHSIN